MNASHHPAASPGVSETAVGGPSAAGTMLALATYGLEIVEVGGTIARHRQADGCMRP